MIQILLDLDTSLLLSARSLISEEYIGLLRISAEMIVVYGALILIGLWLYGVWMKNNLYKISALQIFFTIILTFLIYTVLNFGIPQWRPNPQAISGAIAPLIPHPLDNSFPSGHALFTAALLVGLMRFSRNKGLILGTIIIGIITAIARVIGGIHYPGDIFGGWFFGVIGGLISAHIVIKPLFQKYIFPVFLRVASWIRL